MKKMITSILCLLLTAGFLLVACGQSASAAETAAHETVMPDTKPGPVAEDVFTERELNPSYTEGTGTAITLSDSGIKVSSPNVRVDGSTVTITDEGVYVLTGTLSNGRIIIDAEKSDKIDLVLHGVSVTSEDFAALYVKQADKVFVTLADGTKNTLSNGGSFTLIDSSNVDGAVFSKDDLCFNGNGSLTVQSPTGNGIVCKDELTVTGGSYVIATAGHGLEAKENISICTAAFVIDAGKDGLHAEDNDDETIGDIYIDSGSFTITAGSDGMSAANTLTVASGAIAISGNTASDEVKGLKADSLIEISGGTVAIDTTDDGIHANGDVMISGGTLTICTGDDAIHADNAVTITDGTLAITESHEGIEGKTIDISGGTITLNADDDGLNAAGGNDGSGMMGPWGRDSFASNSDVWIHISGGTLIINAQGDGVDSNGDLLISGGETYVSGPTNSGNGALDYNGTGTITGGIFVAAGASGMSMNFGNTSTQCSMLVSTGTQKGGTELVLTDSSGKELLHWTPEKDYQCVVISFPELKQGSSYTLKCGGSSTDIQLDSVIYGSGTGLGMGGFGGQRPDNGSFGGERPEGSMGGFGGPGGMGGGRPGGFRQ
ncbi:MAG: carbohydrate-binding domain-containing protein [Oscillospiraceae bacterium]|nr:carbohydrate-binding domain-containing protein [Oscillospiraceae bacterium]